MSNTSISLVDVDFDTIKQNLRNYLQRSDSPFKDYDFDGSNISQMLDILSYNTYLNSYYLNMVASEMFLDSAIIRDSVVSHAKELNYVPRSYRSAQAQISFGLTPSSPSISVIVVPKGTTFTAKVGSNNYSFATVENKTFIANSSNIIPITLDVYEGNFLTDSFVYDAANTSQRFVLSNYTVDTRFLTVNSIENNGANVVSYSKYTSFLGVDATTPAFFVQGAENNQYEIIFGDNVKGRIPKSGSTIVVNYLAGNGELPNGARTFSIDGAIQGQSNVSTITTNASAVGGAVNESIESIKLNAPRYYQNQERAVTASDYETLLTTNFPEIAGAAAYGGEDRDPPVYGKVYVAVDLIGADGVSDLDKDRYYKFLKQRSSVSIDPVIEDPDFLYVEVDTTVRYNVNVTNQSIADIKTLVETTISNYNATYLDGFKKTLRSSKLIESINNCHPSILGVDLEVKPFKKFIPTSRQDYSAAIEFGFELTPELVISLEESLRTTIPAIRSTPMIKDGKQVFIMDDGNGVLNLYTTSASGVQSIVSIVGTVDYTMGKAIISKLLIDSYTPASGPHVHLFATPKIKDISSTKNQLIIIDDADIIASVEAIKV